MAAQTLLRIVLDAVDNATGKIKDVSKSVFDLGTAVSVASGQFAFEAVMAGIEGVTQAIGGLLDGMVGGNAQFEQYETQFEVMLGSAELAQQRMDDLATFGATTPFDLPGVVEADRILQGFGLHAADAAERFGFSGEEIRRIAGDVASGSGASFQELAGYIGRFSSGATGEAIARFQELGIVTREQLAGMGLEFAKSGELLSPLPEATEVLLTLMQDKYGGLMEAQSSTFEGMMSNLRDWIGNTLREVGQPIFDPLKDALGDLLGFLNSPSVESTIDQFTALLGNTIGIVLDFIAAFSGGAAIEEFTESLASGLEQVNSFLSQFHDEMLGLTSEDIMGQLADGVEEIEGRLDESLASLAEQHDRTIQQIEGQIATATDRAGAEIAEITEKYAEKTLAIEERSAEARDRINEQIRQSAEDLGLKLAEISEQATERAQQVEERYAEAREQILAQIAEAGARFDEQQAENRARLLERLEEMELAFAEKKRAIQEQIGDKTAQLEEDKAEIKADLEEKLDKLTETHEEKRARLLQELAEATTDEQRGEIQARIKAEEEAYADQKEALEAKAREAEAKLQAKYDREVQRLREKLAREEAEHQRQVEKETRRAQEAEARQAQQHERAVAALQARLANEEAERQQQLAKIEAERAEDEAKDRAANDRKVAELQARLAREDAERQTQLAKIEAQRAEEEAKVREANDRQVAALQARIEAENAAYEQQRADLAAAAEQEIAELETAMTARAEAVGTGFMGRLFAAFREGGLGSLAGEIAAALGFEDLQPQIDQFANETLPGLTSRIREIGDGARGFVENGLNLVRDGFADVQEGIQIFQPIFGGVGTVISTRMAEAKAKFDDFNDQAAPIFLDFSNKFRETWDVAGPAIKDAFERISVAVGDMIVALGLAQEGSTNADGEINLLKGTLDLLISGVMVGTIVIQAIAGAIEKVSEAVEIAIGLWHQMGDIVDLVGDRIPDWLRPGSPPPLFYALQDINRAIDEMPSLSTAFGFDELPAAPALAAVGSAAGLAPAGGGVTIESVTIYANDEEGGRKAARGFVEELRSRGKSIL